MKENTKYWIDISKYDFETAKAMLDTGRYLYVAFMCHQAIEKMLKAIISSQQEDTPPYTHNISLLANLAGLDNEMSNEQKEFLDSLNPYNIEARYPKAKEEIARLCDKETATDIFNTAKEILQWLEQKLN